jgi:hypothetical protein
MNTKDFGRLEVLHLKLGLISRRSGAKAVQNRLASDGL